MTEATGATLPNELERRQIFHSLKRWSSYTAWKRILDFYQVWSDAMEKVVATGENLPRDSPQYKHYRQVALGPDTLVSVLKGLADVEDGVKQLRKGNKQVFKYASHGEFIRSGDPLDHWNHFINHFVKSDGWPLKPELIPHWPELDKAREDVSAAWGECGIHIIQPNSAGAVDPVSRTHFNDYLKDQLNRMVFPDPLPAVPEPAESVLVASGRTVAHSGIWEPVDAPAPKLISLFRQPPPKGPFPIVGTMAYLHGGTSAPKMASSGTRGNGKPCTWRLLWRDDRYEDGSIPEEEKHYVFLQPEAAKDEAPSVAEASATSRTIAESGQQAPTAGRWLVEDDLHAAIEVAAGDALPLHNGRKVRWVLAAT